MTNKALTERANANVFDGTVDISSYNSSSNRYTFPCDGYVVLSSEATSSGVIRAVITDPMGNQIAKMYMNVTNSYQIESLFVKKGMGFWLFQDTTTDSMIEFKKLK